jgi:AcrR family transcriptional regulator
MWGRPVTHELEASESAISSLDGLGQGENEPAAGDARTPAESGLPSTSRGRRTRDRLLKAAEVVFTRDGYLDAKIADIAATAGVANGSFYTYFESKEVIFRTVIQVVIDEMYAAATVPEEVEHEAHVRIEHATRSYMHAYQEHAGLMGILEQVATFNPGFREMRRGIRQAFRARTEKGLRRLQRDGLIDPDLSPKCAAEALGSMVSNFCYVSFVLGETYPDEEAVRTVTTLWMRGIGLAPRVGVLPMSVVTVGS